MNVVRVKPSVQFTPIAPGGFHILSALDQVAPVAGVDLVISCGSEGHAADDPHTRGEAFDVSVAGFDVDHVLDVRGRLMHLLGPMFTVLYERPDTPADVRLAAIAYVNPLATAPHLHVQVRNGRSFPPVYVAPPLAAV